MGISIAGLIGAVVGTIVAAINYYLFLAILDRGARERESAQSPGERDSYDYKMSLVRRLVLTVDLVVFAGAGYWVGRTFFE